MDKNKITVLEGLGSFVDATHVAVAKADGTLKLSKQKHHYCYRFKTIFTFIKIDKERIITSTEALKLKEVPKHLVLLVVELLESN
jgi:dihydrolipoamide dehydrogenase